MRPLSSTYRHSGSSDRCERAESRPAATGLKSGQAGSAQKSPFAAPAADDRFGEFQTYL